MPNHLCAQIISLQGPDATAFAQAQFGSDLRRLACGRWQFSAWLDAQGRVLALFHLIRIAEDEFVLVLRGGDAASIAASMQRYLLRSRVSIQARPAATIASGPALSMYTATETDDGLVLGCGDHSMRIGVEHGDAMWRLAQMRSGWPWLPESMLGELLAPMLSLRRLGAVSIDKGCYPGQEVVARLHYRGGNKRHMHSVLLSQLLPPGTAMQRDGHTIVQLLDVMSMEDGAAALAIVRDDATASASTGELMLDGVALCSTQRWTDASDASADDTLAENVSKT